MILLKQPLRKDSPANTDDVLKVKTALIKTGYYSIPDYGLTPYPDKALFDAIKSYQKDVDLKVDGIINPHGETITLLSKEAEEEESPGVRSPTIRCPQCGGPHGGSKGDLCPDCDAKN